MGKMNALAMDMEDKFIDACASLVEVSETFSDYKYTASTQLNAYVTQGGASAGTAVVTVLYSGRIS